MELIDDLANKFLESFDPGHDRLAVKNYGHYFLGSIIVSDKEGQKFIIDGQQRLTTLTLILIFLYHQLHDPEQQGLIAKLIFAAQYGKRSFNLDVPDRTPCMDALYQGKEFVDPDPPESIANILGRYNDIGEAFPALAATALGSPAIGEPQSSGTVLDPRDVAVPGSADATDSASGHRCVPP